MGYRVIQPLAVIVQTDTAQDFRIYPVVKLYLLAGDLAKLGGQLFHLCRIQGNGGDGGNGQNAVVTVIAFFECLAAVKEMASL